MTLIDILKNKLNPNSTKPIKSYEISSKEYLANYLTPADAVCLKYFVSDLTSNLSIPVAILAVGSSTFPDEHWERRRKLNKEDPTLDARESYLDIDLLIVPKKVVKLDQLEKEIQNALNVMELSFKPHEITYLGSRYSKGQMLDKGILVDTYVPFLDVDYGLHSISTNLANSTNLDLILGRDDLLKKTAKRKIKEERKNNSAFSLLYDF